MTDNLAGFPEQLLICHPSVAKRMRKVTFCSFNRGLFEIVLVFILFLF